MSMMMSTMTHSGDLNMKIENIFESKKDNKKLYGNEWLSLRVKDGWFTYVHEEKSDGRGVAIIGFKKDENDDYRFTAHMEPHVTNLKTLRMASITGQMDKENEEAKATAIREMEEEAGIKITEDELVNCSDPLIHSLFCRLKNRGYLK